ncbi:hypothetical protein [Aurantimonas sp. 22II-16-19i]|uniref:hypothetical protein n=1 Tax=Aurantimonas sp. 22II-16-19i TaxID=1317114 RepID=UPI0009F7ADA3|nr:hypothetical protein [Aurantimonas sp. 22II-16-19i]ORE97757.1 hypothetical protein ATO4_07455 [Aurantimonas sp. 22II-16-19i]
MSHSIEERPLEVYLANVGNPDFNEDPGHPLPLTRSGFWFPVADLRHASKICGHYISTFDLGGGNWAGGVVRRREDQTAVARISYNGRAWRPVEDSLRDREEMSLGEDVLAAPTASPRP